MRFDMRASNYISVNPLDKASQFEYILIEISTIIIP